MKTPLVDIKALVKTYQKAKFAIPVLCGIDLCLFEGEFLVVMGASGSGKSTLLNIIGCLDRPNAGSYLLDGVDVLASSDDQLSHLRSQCLGFVFQTFNLIPNLSVMENVQLPFLYRSVVPHKMYQQVQDAINRVDLTSRANHKPSELSGGELQRVAIARALAIEPKLILADEPTGNLDSKSSENIMQLFKNLHSQGSTIVLVTHNQQVAAYADSRLTIHDGQVFRESI